jgi:signal transduction histidine kinase
LGNVEMALEEGEMDEATREKLVDILTAANRIRQVTHALIHFADARRTQEAELLDINTAIREAVQLASYSLARDGIQVTAECSPQTLLVLGRRGDLEEVVVQLVRNAGEAIIQARKGSQVLVRTYQRNGWGRIEVDDDGPGVPVDLRDRIFIPFVTTKAERGGTGLGLAIVQNIVVAHRGRVWVEESPLGGARFIVELPLWQPATGTPVAEVSQPERG